MKTDANGSHSHCAVRFYFKLFFKALILKWASPLWIYVKHSLCYVYICAVLQLWFQQIMSDIVEGQMTTQSCGPFNCCRQLCVIALSLLDPVISYWCLFDRCQEWRKGCPLCVRCLQVFIQWCIKSNKIHYLCSPETSKRFSWLCVTARWLYSWERWDVKLHNQRRNTP